MTRIDIDPADAAEIARLCYLLTPGRILTRAEVVARVLHEWRRAKRANLAELAESP